MTAPADARPLLSRGPYASDAPPPEAAFSRFALSAVFALLLQSSIDPVGSRWRSPADTSRAPVAATAEDPIANAFATAKEGIRDANVRLTITSISAADL